MRFFILILFALISGELTYRFIHRINLLIKNRINKSNIKK